MILIVERIEIREILLQPGEITDQHQSDKAAEQANSEKKKEELTEFLLECEELHNEGLICPEEDKQK